MAAEQTILHAGFVHIQDEGEIAMVGFADNEHDAKEYVLLQRTLCPSGNDIDRGWDNVHIMVNDESRSAYGGILQITLSNKQVIIEVTLTTAAHLQTAETIHVNMDCAQADVGELTKMLKLLCGDYVQFIEDAMD